MENSKITGISFASQSVICLTITQGRIEGGAQKDYVVQTGDRVEENPTYGQHTKWVIRNGEKYGVLVWDTTNWKVWLPEKLVEQRFIRAVATDISCYTLTDETSGIPITVEEIFYKSKPVNGLDPTLEFIVEHNIFIKLNGQMAENNEYKLAIEDFGLAEKELRFHFNPFCVKSPAVHATQLGYKSSDGEKKAYLSLWMGSGNMEYTNVRFKLVNEQNNVACFEGTGTLARDESPFPLKNGDEISTYSPVYQLDFSEYSKPGVYRIYVENVGCSFPFEIDESVWEKAFRISMKGLLHHRSGIELKAPYTDYIRPRPYHSNDGKLVYQSKCSLLKSGNGLNAFGTDTGNFGHLVEECTNELVPDAWGSYFDACDWDRRIQHLYATRLGTELYLLYPDYFNNINLNIPESKNGIADILNEGMYNIDGYRRMQLPNGGIRGGIEAEDHPMAGQCAWQDTLKAMAYAPDHWSSYSYAATAARMALALKLCNNPLADVYAKSATRACEWGLEEEAHLAEEQEMYTEDAKFQIRAMKTLMGIEMYRLTNTAKYLELFINDIENAPGEALFSYCMSGDKTILDHCKKKILDRADYAVWFTKQNPYNMAMSAEYAYTGMYGAFYSVPDCYDLLRAFALTGNKKYKDAAALACNVTCGGNPMDMSFTTGIGTKTPQAVLHHDSRRTGQKTPDGITVYGNYNLRIAKNQPSWIFNNIKRHDAMFPEPEKWPTLEAYLDVYLFPHQCEYTVMQTIGPMAYMFGFLAAAK